MSTSLAATLGVLQQHVPLNLLSPRVLVVCGSGLSKLANIIEHTVRIPYDIIPGFGHTAVAGHQNYLAFGFIGSIPVVAMLGRLHAYEGHALSDVTYPIQVMSHLGVKTVILTNAAGSLNKSIDVGTIVVVEDHIALPCLTGFNPLLGPVLSPTRSRFLSLSTAYSRSLRRLAFFAAHDLLFPRSSMAEGTYAWVTGPTYETMAEGRFLRSIGADVVGASTVPEVIVARSEGMEILVLSLVTNFVVIPDVDQSMHDAKKAPGTEQVVSHEEVLVVGEEKSAKMMQLVEQIVKLL